MKITKKGNVKIDGVKYVFVADSNVINRGCAICDLSFQSCGKAPCLRESRAAYGQPAEEGYFKKVEQK